MIRIYPKWHTMAGVGKEREMSVGSQELFAQIDFIGDHFLPIQDIPSRVMGMKEGQYAIVYENNSLNTVVIGLDTTFLLLKGTETVIENQRATRIFRPLYRPGIGGGDFIDINMFGQNLARYSREQDSKECDPRDIPGFNDLKRELWRFKKCMAQKKNRERRGWGI